MDSSDCTRSAPASSRTFRSLVDAANEAVLSPERYAAPRCFRLVLDLYARCGVRLPDLLEGKEEGEFFRNVERFSALFRPAEPPYQPGDVMVFSKRGTLTHFAVVVDERLAIHAGRAIRVATQRVASLLLWPEVEVMRYAHD